MEVISIGKKATWCDPGGIRISSDEDDRRRIFLGLKFSIPGFFGVGKFGKYFFVVWLNLSGDFKSRVLKTI